VEKDGGRCREERGFIIGKYPKGGALNHQGRLPPFNADVAAGHPPQEKRKERSRGVRIKGGVVGAQKQKCTCWKEEGNVELQIAPAWAEWAKGVNYCIKGG